MLTDAKGLVVVSGLTTVISNPIPLSCPVLLCLLFFFLFFSWLPDSLVPGAFHVDEPVVIM